MNKRMTKLILEGQNSFKLLFMASWKVKHGRAKIFMREISLKTIKNNGFVVINYN